MDTANTTPETTNPDASTPEASTSESTAPADAPETTDLPACKCGHDKTHYMVSAERRYTVWGWFLALFMNAGATPNKIEWRCRRCREIIDASSDPDVCNNNRA
jgi:hypothetical protein